ncbi:hypothetical protein SE17_00080 [Kouleothrix aurantiaca]|uniref:Helicase ATP-binding domain-containing protein n=1 Tax=Kouleothrix aurantiaca TaxID=186479 RepID=A0A0P9DNH3_9CHLR|nr:hypothetical protein SE17_00080 [Kouleothrix aurantiaca]
MARIESQALGGYYALPADHIGPIAALIDPSACGKLAIIDPCAADGAAVLGILDTWCDSTRITPNLFACELETERAETLRQAVNTTLGWHAGQYAVQGDAFRLTWKGGGHVLYLNPPYDTDAQTKRLEHRFLVRFTDVLMPGHGALLLVVPHYALAASAAHLATHYDSVSCFRFFPEAFEQFKQVVLVARRRESPLPNPDDWLLARIHTWAADAATIPTLAADPAPVLKLSGHLSTLEYWRMTPIDVHGYQAAMRVGMDASGGMKRYGLDQPMAALLGGQPYELAMPPRPGHIAQALSAGIMNGAVLRPDAGYLPDLLAKGVFERELVTVERKTNKEGETIGVVQVQQPSLRLCVLDIDNGRYYDVKPGTVPTAAEDLDTFTVADLLDRYQGAMGDVMARMCPAIHPINDPSARLPLPALARTPYRAQLDAISATLKLLGRGIHPFVIGEVGTGKSTIALAVIAALQSHHVATVRSALSQQGHAADVRPVQRALVLCPPHLLEGWRDQMRAVVPGAGVVIIQSISDVHADVPSPNPDAPGAGLTFFILSREAAKLSHGVAAARTAQQTCPRCGAFVVTVDSVLAKERRRCTHQPMQPANTPARIATDLAVLLTPAAPMNARVQHYAPQRLLRASANRVFARLADLPKEDQLAAYQALWDRRWRGIAASFESSPLGALAQRITAYIAKTYRKASDSVLEELILMLGMLLFSAGDAAHAALVAHVRTLYLLTTADASPYGKAARVRNALREVIALLPPDAPMQQAVIRELQALNLDKNTYPSLTASNPWDKLTKTIARLHADLRGEGPVALEWGDYAIRITNTLRWRDHVAGPRAVEYALELLSKHATWNAGAVCNEPLYSAVPTPRRYSIAKYITRHAPNRFDLLVLDEGHEFAGDGSAQEIAAHRLSELGKPTLLLTGSLMNGYASGLFRNLWALSRRFRTEFRRDEVTNFVTRYGYRKVLSEAEDDQPAAVASYGATTDRRDADMRVIRTLGEAPGVLPLLLLQHLLPIAVTIQKSDLDDALPPATPEIITIPADRANFTDTVLRTRGRALLTATARQIGQDSFSGLAGKLFGALGQLPSFYDRATQDTGNGVASQATQRWDVRYPESIGAGLVTSADLFSADTILPKEQWMLDTLTQELDEGRNILIYITHANLAERLRRLIAEQLGVEAVILTANAASTQKREAWINQKVITPGKRIMIANPVTVQTGLNNLVHFATVLWMENPNCNAIVFRQANGRVHRIGQTKAVRIFVPVYGDTAQTLAQELLTRKIMASEQVDGADVQASLEAAGAGEREAIDTLELGRAIYAMMTKRAA